MYNETASLATKIGTMILDKVDKLSEFMDHLDSSNKIANEICHLFGCDGIVSGRQLREGVNQGRVGKSPPRRGRKSMIENDEFEAMASLLFTATSIEQANCTADRRERPELITLVGGILNDKLRAAGSPEMDDGSFYKRLEKRNSLMTSMDIIDKRDAIRVKWLRRSILSRHYKAFDQAMVDYGFARWPKDEKERQEHGFVVYHPGVEHRMIQADEFAVSLSGSEEGKGG